VFSSSTSHGMHLLSNSNLQSSFCCTLIDATYIISTIRSLNDNFDMYKTFSKFENQNSRFGIIRTGWDHLASLVTKDQDLKVSNSRWEGAAGAIQFTILSISRMVCTLFLNVRMVWLNWPFQIQTEGSIIIITTIFFAQLKTYLS
jgi:hypothetical protein